MSHLRPGLRKPHYHSLWKPCQKMNNKEFWFDVSMGEGFISAVCRGVWHVSSMELLCLQVLFLCTILAYAQLHLLFSIRDIIIFLPRQCLVGSVPYFPPNLELGMSLNCILLSPTFCWPNTQRSPMNSCPIFLSVFDPFCLPFHTTARLWFPSHCQERARPCSLFFQKFPQASLIDCLSLTCILVRCHSRKFCWVKWNVTPLINSPMSYNPN